jgi:hypothetical protein
MSSPAENTCWTRDQRLTAQEAVFNWEGTVGRMATDQLCPVLPGGRHHGHFPQMWQFKKIDGRGKFVAVSGRKVAVKGPKRLKCGRRKLFYKSLVKLIENMIKALPAVHNRGCFP